VLVAWNSQVGFRRAFTRAARHIAFACQQPPQLHAQSSPSPSASSQAEHRIEWGLHQHRNHARECAVTPDLRSTFCPHHIDPTPAMMRRRADSDVDFFHLTILLFDLGAHRNRTRSHTVLSRIRSF